MAADVVAMLSQDLLGFVNITRKAGEADPSTTSGEEPSPFPGVSGGSGGVSGASGGASGSAGVCSG